jgi:hypothetical protein
VQLSAGKTATVLFIQLGIRTRHFPDRINAQWKFWNVSKQTQILLTKKPAVQELHPKHFLVTKSLITKNHLCQGKKETSNMFTIES